MYTSVPVHFHIICDDGAQEYLEQRLALITRPRHDVLVRFYPVTLEKMRARIEREGAITTDHSAGIREYPIVMRLHFAHYNQPLMYCMLSNFAFHAAFDNDSWSHETLHPRDLT